MAEESWVAERAREELEMLEQKYPGRFDYLKLELEALISQPYNKLFYQLTDREDAFRTLPPLIPSCSSAPTQVSTNKKKRKAEEALEKRVLGPMDTVDMAIQKAEQCLKRIRQVKRSIRVIR